MSKVSGFLKRILSSLQHIKLDKKRAKEFLEPLQVLECFIRSIDYMIQFFKKTVIKNYICKGYTTSIGKRVRMQRVV